MGARVIAAARGATKTEFCRRLGAETVDLLQDDLPAAVLRLTGNKGVTVVYETVGSPLLEAALKCVKWGGRVVVIGFAGGTPPKAPTNLLLVKHTDLLGVYWGGLFQRSPRVVSDSLATLMAMMDSGVLPPPVVTHQYPWRHAMDAVQALRQREITGKAILVIHDDFAKL